MAASAASGALYASQDDGGSFTAIVADGGGNEDGRGVGVGDDAGTAATLSIEGDPGSVSAGASVCHGSAVDAAAKPLAASTITPMDDGFKLHGLPFVLVLFAVSLAVFIGSLDDTIVVVAMPAIAAEFESLSTISWVVLSLILAQTAGTPLWGRATDMLGRKVAMLASIGSFVAGSIACALSTTFAMLVVFRAVQGLAVRDS